MEYTKGEWVLNKEPYLGKDTYIIWVAGKGKIAQVTASEADAHLIVATPDLYEALTELREWLMSEDVQVLGKGLTEQFGIPKTQEKVDKALAKAEVK